MRGIKRTSSSQGTTASSSLRGQVSSLFSFSSKTRKEIKQDVQKAGSLAKDASKKCDKMQKISRKIGESVTKIEEQTTKIHEAARRSSINLNWFRRATIKSHHKKVDKKTAQFEGLQKQVEQQEKKILDKIQEARYQVVRQNMKGALREFGTIKKIWKRNVTNNAFFQEDLHQNPPQPEEDTHSRFLEIFHGRNSSQEEFKENFNVFQEIMDEKYGDLEQEEQGILSGKHFEAREDIGAGLLKSPRLEERSQEVDGQLEALSQRLKEARRVSQEMKKKKVTHDFFERINIPYGAEESQEICPSLQEQDAVLYHKMKNLRKAYEGLEGWYLRGIYKDDSQSHDKDWQGKDPSWFKRVILRYKKPYNPLQVKGLEKEILTLLQQSTQNPASRESSFHSSAEENTRDSRSMNQNAWEIGSRGSFSF